MTKILFSIFILIYCSDLRPQVSVGIDKDKFSIKFNRPSIEFSYGLSEIKLGKSDLNLSDAGMLELKLGFTEEKKTKFDEQIIKYMNRFIFLGNASNKNLSKSQSITLIDNSLWRFGFGDKSGYGIKLGSFAILPYNSSSISWSEFTYERNDFNEDSIYAALDDFNGTFRFGTTTEAGINFQLFKGFSIESKYELADIYPRHLFTENMVSLLIEAVGLELLDGFTGLILKNSPFAGVFVNFILKNAYEFGFYQLRKENMNWPFTSASPLRYGTFKIGMNFVF